MKSFKGINKQDGIAMIMALLILIVITLIALSGSRNTTLQLKMASNLQSRVEAIQFAQAGLDYAEVIDISGLSQFGDSVCTSGLTNSNGNACNKGQINVNSTGVLNESDSTLLIEHFGVGVLESTSYNVATADYIRVESTYDKTDDGQGRAKLIMGIKKLNLQAPQ